MRGDERTSVLLRFYLRNAIIVKREKLREYLSPKARCEYGRQSRHGFAEPLTIELTEIRPQQRPSGRFGGRAKQPTSVGFLS